MEFEPVIPEPRQSEALLIAVDSYTKSTSTTAFQSLRDAAMRLARTRLIYAVSKDDLLAVVKCGSANTKNSMHDLQGAGYDGLEVLRPISSKSLEAVRALANLTPGLASSNLLDIMEVCGDEVSQPAADRAKKKRVILFTDGVDLCQSVKEERDIEDFKANCETYEKASIQVDVICYCDDKTEEDIQQAEVALADLSDATIEEQLQTCSRSPLSYLQVLCERTGGQLASYRDSFALVDMPTAKVKRANAKYRGTMNIANILKIPVKRFSYVSEATPPTGKKLSWNATVKQKKQIFVDVETQRVASAKDDTPLQATEIVNAYPYGPELVPEQNDVDTYAWSIHLRKGLDVLGFIDVDSVPQNLFTGKVDVLLAMSSVQGAEKLMKTLVLALTKEKLGVLARSVSPLKGGVPTLAFLWPRIEADGETGALRNFFLFMVDIAVKEDIRDLPFASLQEEMDQLPKNATAAMDRYIEASMLEADENGNNMEDGDEEDEYKAFWPPDICNPNLDWFNICIVHRALAGITDTEFPSLSEWHRNLLSPTSFIREMNKEPLQEAIKDLKTALPLIPVKRKEKKGKRVLEALNGEMASIADYLPAEMVEFDNDEIDFDDREDDVDENVAISKFGNDISDNMSEVTDVDVVDVGEETPVADFNALVRNGKCSFAAASMLVVVRRLIRDLVDDDKAMRCLKVLRKVCVEEKEARIFNDFIINSVARCNKKDLGGNRMAAFFRYVGRRGEIEETLRVIPVVELSSGDKESRGYQAYREFLEDVSDQTTRIAAQKETALSASTAKDSRGDAHQG